MVSFQCNGHSYFEVNLQNRLFYNRKFKNKITCKTGNIETRFDSNPIFVSSFWRKIFMQTIFKLSNSLMQKRQFCVFDWITPEHGFHSKSITILVFVDVSEFVSKIPFFLLKSVKINCVSRRKKLLRLAAEVFKNLFRRRRNFWPAHGSRGECLSRIFLINSLHTSDLFFTQYSAS